MADFEKKFPGEDYKNQEWWKDYCKQMQDAHKDGWHPAPDPGKGCVVSAPNTDANVAEASAASAPKAPVAASASYSTGSYVSSGSYSYASSGSYTGSYSYVTSGSYAASYSYVTSGSYVGSYGYMPSGSYAAAYRYPTSGTFQGAFPSSGSAVSPAVQPSGNTDPAELIRAFMASRLPQPASAPAAPASSADTDDWWAAPGRIVTAEPEKKSSESGVLGYGLDLL